MRMLKEGPTRQRHSAGSDRMERKCRTPAIQAAPKASEENRHLQPKGPRRGGRLTWSNSVPKDLRIEVNG
jgi:hypothetical protein